MIKANDKLANYITACIGSSADDGDGMCECAYARARDAADAIGALCEILSRKQMLTADEIALVLCRADDRNWEIIRNEIAKRMKK